MESLVGGLKKGVARGYGLAEHYERKSKVLEAMLVKSWVAADSKAVEKMAWEYVGMFPAYGKIASSVLGIMSEIRSKLKQKGYTNKKGVSHADKWEDAHHTNDGTFLGWVSVMGTEPVSYSKDLQITRKNFTFVHNIHAKCVADFFSSETIKVFDTDGVKVRDCVKKTYKTERKAVYESWDEAREKHKAEKPQLYEEELDEEEDYEYEEED
jgi:Zn ribbon nucleic-acid-binding protein